MCLFALNFIFRLFLSSDEGVPSARGGFVTGGDFVLRLRFWFMVFVFLFFVFFTEQAYVCKD